MAVKAWGCLGDYELEAPFIARRLQKQLHESRVPVGQDAFIGVDVVLCALTDRGVVVDLLSSARREGGKGR